MRKNENPNLWISDITFIVTYNGIVIFILFLFFYCYLHIICVLHRSVIGLWAEMWGKMKNGEGRLEEMGFMLTCWKGRKGIYVVFCEDWWHYMRLSLLSFVSVPLFSLSCSFYLPFVWDIDFISLTSIRRPFSFFSLLKIDVLVCMWLCSFLLFITCHTLQVNFYIHIESFGPLSWWCFMAPCCAFSHTSPLTSKSLQITKKLISFPRLTITIE